MNPEETEPVAAIAETPPARQLPGRYPLLAPLVALVAGYGAAMGGAYLPACVAVIVAVVAGGLAFRYAADARRWALFLLPGVVCLAIVRFHDRCPPPPDRTGLPVREAVLTVRIGELFQGKPDALSGLGVVTGAPPHLAAMKGASLRFQASRLAPDARRDIGAEIVLRGVLEPVPDEPGFSRYLRRRGVAYALSRCRIEAVPVPASGFRIACSAARARVASALASGVDVAGASRLSALMLGRTALLPQRERDDFKKAGATHLFAISGLHITGMAAGILWLARRLRIPDMASVPATLATLWLYVMMTGAPPSAMRAWIMAAALFGAKLADRGARPAGGLVFAAFATLVADPGAIRDPGFLLSYVVVAAILFYAVPAAEMWETRRRPWRFVPTSALGRFRRAVLAARRPAIGALTTTFAATVAGTPLAATLFGGVSPVGLVANLAMVPVSGPPVLLGLVSALCGAAGLPAWAAPFNRIAALFMELLAFLAGTSARVPGGYREFRVDAVWATAFSATTVLVALLAAPVRPDRSAWRAAVLPAVMFLDLAVLGLAG